VISHFSDINTQSLRVEPNENPLNPNMKKEINGPRMIDLKTLRERKEWYGLNFHPIG
jgi:hypothetical protein